MQSEEGAAMPWEEEEMFKNCIIAGLGFVLCTSAHASVTYQDTVGDIFDSGHSLGGDFGWGEGVAISDWGGGDFGDFCY